MKRLPTAGIVVALFLAGSSHGDETRSFIIGSHLAESCAAPEADPKHLPCLVYVSGVSDTVHFLQSANYFSKVYCAPKGVTQGQLAAVFSKYLQDHPAKRHLAAASLVFAALTDAFPCEKDAVTK